MSDICKLAYPGIDRVEKKHRVAAARKIGKGGVERMRHFWLASAPVCRALRGSVVRASERGTRRRLKRDASHFVVRREPSPASFIWIVGSGLSDCTVHAKRKDRICERTEFCRVLPYRFLVYRPPAAWPVKLRLFRRSTGEQWNNKWPARPTVFRLCGAQIPDVNRIVACLQQNTPQLSGPCRAVFNSSANSNAGVAQQGMT